MIGLLSSFFFFFESVVFGANGLLEIAFLFLIIFGKEKP